MSCTTLAGPTPKDRLEISSGSNSEERVRLKLDGALSWCEMIKPNAALDRKLTAAPQ